MTEVLLDSSAWIEFFAATALGKKVKEVVEQGKAATSIVSLAEIGVKVKREGGDVDAHLLFVRQESRIVGLDLDVATKAGPFMLERRKKRPAFGIMDAIIYLSAQEEGLSLLTKDADFKGLQGVEML